MQLLSAGDLPKEDIFIVSRGRDNFAVWGEFCRVEILFVRADGFDQLTIGGIPNLDFAKQTRFPRRQ